MRMQRAEHTLQPGGSVKDRGDITGYSVSALGVGVQLGMCFTR